MHEYEKTHPWISFRLNLDDFDYRTWLLLGEAESKCQHIAGTPLRPEVADQLHRIYLSKGIHGTTSIEGNTLSEDEVLRRVAGELDLPPSREYQGREVDNIVAVCNEIVRATSQGRPMSLTQDRIVEFNRRILQGLPTGEDVVPGALRGHSVGVANYRGAPAKDCEYLLNRLCYWLDELVGLRVEKPELNFTLAILRAIMAHLYIAWIHPFADGNGRTARLIEFQLMVQAGVPIPAAHLLSDHYNRTRTAYYVELDKTSHGHFPVDGFVRYAVQGFVDELRDQLLAVREQQMDVTWENYVHTSLGGDTPAKRRQKHLVLDMPKGQPVPVGRLRLVSPRIAAEYAGKTSKTVTRDVNALARMALVRRERGGVVANRDLMKAFLPLVADPC